MLYRILADLVFAGHLAFVLFVLFGAWAAVRWRRVLWPHLAAVAWGVFVQCANWTCPLTPLENHFLRLSGEAGYAGGFVEHYASAIIYPEHVGAALRFASGLFLVIINLFAYSFVFYDARRAARRPLTRLGGQGGLRG
jgi:hypothetical protein